MTRPLIAWQLGVDGEGTPCMGAAVDQDIGKEKKKKVGGKTVGLIPNVNAFFGINARGPIYAGQSRGGEKHVIGKGRTSDGELQCSGHLSVCSYFKWPEGGFDYDAPLYFSDEDYPSVLPEMPFKYKGKFQYNPGVTHEHFGASLPGRWDIITDSDTTGTHDDVPPGDEGVVNGSGEGGLSSGAEGGADDPESSPPTKPKPKKPDHEDKTKKPSGLCGGKPDPDKHKKDKKKKKSPKHDVFVREGGFRKDKPHRINPFHTSFTGIYAKPNPTVIGENSKDFTDYHRGFNEKDFASYKLRSPITAQLLAYGGFPSSWKEATYFEEPYTNTKFLSGSGPGGFIFAPPQTDLASLRQVSDGTRSEPYQWPSGFSRSFFNILREQSLSFGFPNLSDGGHYLGFSVRSDSSNTLSLSYHETSGTETEVATVSPGPTGAVDFVNVLQSDNIKRKSGDPNGSVLGNRGDLYQDTTGSLWYKTVADATNTDWIQVLGNTTASSGKNIVSKAVNYTITTSDDVILGDASGGTIKITLPLASTTHSSGKSKEYIVKKIDTSATYDVQVDTTSSELIDGATSVTLTGSSYPHLTVVSDGTQYWTI